MAKFPEVAGQNLEVDAAISDGAGGWFIGGYFDYVGGLARHDLAHIRPDGTVDPNFDPQANGPVYALALSGSFLYVGGAFTNIGGNPHSHLARVSTTTGSSDSWAPDPDGSAINAIAVSGSGSNTTVYAAGDFSNIGGVSQQWIAAVDDNGNVKTTWTPNPDNGIDSIVVSGSNVYVGGGFTNIGGIARNHLAELDATTGDGVSAFAPDVDGFVDGLALSGSTLYLGGSFSNIDAEPRAYIGSVDASTGAVQAWDPEADDNVQSLRVSGSTVYATGGFSNIGGQPRNSVAALDATTGDANVWNPKASSYVDAVAVSGSTVYVAGSFTSLGAEPRNNLAALDATTGALTSWNPDAEGGSVDTLALSAGTVYAGGYFTSVGGVSHNYIAAIGSNGVAATWDPGADAPVESLAVSGSTIYAGGYFTNIGGQPRNGIAKLASSDGSADPSWNPDLGAHKAALVMRLSSDGVLYIAGSFTSIGADSRNGLGAIDAATGGDETWDPSVDGAVDAITVSGSTVYIGGGFTHVDGQPRVRLAAISANDSTVVLPWDPEALSNDVVALAISGNTVYAAGYFTLIGGEEINELAAIDATTGDVTPTWKPITEAVGGSYVNNLAVGADGTVYAGGTFYSIGARAQTGFAAFSPLPENTNPPTISGTASPGSTLSCAPGLWLGRLPQTYTYAWLRDGSATPGATNANYVVTAADAGHAISCRVTATNEGGSGNATSAGVNVPAPPVAPPPTPPPPPPPPPTTHCVVPNIVGKTPAKAETALRSHHCKVGVVGHAYSTKRKKGHVVSQSRKAGRWLPAGTKVNLVVGRGPKPRKHRR